MAVYSSLVTLQFYTDGGTSFYQNVGKMIANILAIFFLLKLSTKTRLNAPNYNELEQLTFARVDIKH